jgi:hypothetical protein
MQHRASVVFTTIAEWAFRGQARRTSAANASRIYRRSCTLAFTVEQHNVVTGQNGNFHIILRPQPRPFQPQCQVQHVPEGGAGWVFVLAALAVIGWAAIKRYSEKGACQPTT